MPIQLPTPKQHVRSRGWSGPALTTAGLCFVRASAAWTLIWTIPPPLVLPSIGVLATIAAAGVALIAWMTAQHLATALSYWDVAGALTLVGVVATLLSEPELVLPCFDNQRTE